jgi:hypothetical protein
MKTLTRGVCCAKGKTVGLVWMLSSLITAVAAEQQRLKRRQHCILGYLGLCCCSPGHEEKRNLVRRLVLLICHHS